VFNTKQAREEKQDDDETSKVHAAAAAAILEEGTVATATRISATAVVQQQQQQQRQESFSSSRSSSECRHSLRPRVGRSPPLLCWPLPRCHLAVGGAAAAAAGCLFWTLWEGISTAAVCCDQGSTKLSQQQAGVCQRAANRHCHERDCTVMAALWIHAPSGLHE